MSATVMPAASQRTPMLIIGLLFFIFGFVTWMNGPLIQFVELAFELDTVNAFLVLMAFYLSYFFLALPAAAILRATGMKRGMAIGLFVMALGALAFASPERVDSGAVLGARAGDVEHQASMALRQ